MVPYSSFSDHLTLFQKIKSLDYLLLFCLLVLGIISCFAMYSSEGGEILYYTKNHAIRFVVFFVMMFLISFINIKFWHKLGYFFYLISLVLLIFASFYGVKISGSQRWINLFIFNLQPSELMKIAIIICFAKFYHRIQVSNVNKLKNLIIPFVILQAIAVAIVFNFPQIVTWLPKVAYGP